MLQTLFHLLCRNGQEQNTANSRHHDMLREQQHDEFGHELQHAAKHNLKSLLDIAKTHVQDLSHDKFKAGHSILKHAFLKYKDGEYVLYVGER